MASSASEIDGTGLFIKKQNKKITASLHVFHCIGNAFGASLRHSFIKLTGTLDATHFFNSASLPLLPFLAQGSVEKGVREEGIETRGIENKHLPNETFLLPDASL